MLSCGMTSYLYKDYHGVLDLSIEQKTGRSNIEKNKRCFFCKSQKDKNISNYINNVVRIA